jgi:hypothetical protein
MNNETIINANNINMISVDLLWNELSKYVIFSIWNKLFKSYCWSKLKKFDFEKNLNEVIFYNNNNNNNNNNKYKFLLTNHVHIFLKHSQ